MNVVIFDDVAKIVEGNPGEDDVLITKDGAKLIRLNGSGLTPVSAMLSVFSGVMKALDNVEGKTFYMSPGSMECSGNACRFSIVVGLSGDTELEKKINARQQAVTPDIVDVPQEESVLEPGVLNVPETGC
jgi:hypothetical protein